MRNRKKMLPQSGYPGRLTGRAEMGLALPLEGWYKKKRAAEAALSITHHASRITHHA
jgi:hypothetical protein